MTNMELRPDAVMKNYLRNPERFAALANYCLSPGKDIISVESVKELDTDVAAALSSHKSIRKKEEV